ncbi:recombinase family protein [Anaeromassilibacillus senegalensis]|uniref:recombinase family protein n=1 Tax=Anaeromassilibacillus senegalensis TaxID=1673717 RepID=UPI0038B4073C
MIRAAGYARYSTDKQCSIEVQYAVIKKHCADNGYYLPDNRLYKDEALTGTNLDRKGYEALMRAVEAGMIDCIVLYDLTRGSRDVVDWFSFRREMRARGVAVESCMDRLGDLDNPSDFLTELITVGIGQTHVLTSRIKSMDKIDYLAQQGKFLGGYAPFGYSINDGQYIIRDDEAPVIKMIFEMYASGRSYDQILAALPSGLRGRRGKPFGKNTLHEILKNERYAGTYTWCKRQVKYMTKWAGGGPSDRAVKIEGVIPPIVTKEIWEKVRKRMEENKHNKLNNSRRGRTYLLTGVLYCGECGAAMIGNTTTNKKGYEYKSYICGAKSRQKTCKAKNMPANDIEPLVVSLLKKSLFDQSMIEATADGILAAAAATDGEDAKALQNSYDAIEAKISNLTDVLADGFSSDAVRQKLADLEVRRGILAEKIKALQSTVTLTRDELIAELTKDADRLKNDPRFIKEVLKKYITRIDVYADRIEIHSLADFSSILPEEIKKAPASSLPMTQTPLVAEAGFEPTTFGL